MRSAFVSWLFLFVFGKKKGTEDEGDQVGASDMKTFSRVVFQPELYPLMGMANRLIFVYDYEAAYSLLIQIFQKNFDFEVGVRCLEVAFKAKKSASFEKKLLKMKGKKGHSGEWLLLMLYLKARSKLESESLEKAQSDFFPPFQGLLNHLDLEAEEPGKIWMEFSKFDEMQEGLSSSFPPFNQEDLELFQEMNFYLRDYPDCYAAWYVQGFLSELYQSSDLARQCWRHAYDLNAQSLAVLSVLCNLQSLISSGDSLESFCDDYQKLDPTLVHGNLETHLSVFRFFFQKGEEVHALNSLQAFKDWSFSQNHEIRLESEMVYELGALKWSESFDSASDFKEKEEQFLFKLKGILNYQSEKTLLFIEGLMINLGFFDLMMEFFLLVLHHPSLSLRFKWDVSAKMLNGGHRLRRKHLFFLEQFARQNSFHVSYQRLFLYLKYQKKGLKQRRELFERSLMVLSSMSQSSDSFQEDLMKLKGELEVFSDRGEVDFQALFLILALQFLLGERSQAFFLLTRIAELAFELRRQKTLESVLLLFAYLKDYLSLKHYLHRYHLLFGEASSSSVIWLADLQDPPRSLLEMDRLSYLWSPLWLELYLVKSLPDLACLLMTPSSRQLVRESRLLLSKGNLEGALHLALWCFLKVTDQKEVQNLIVDLFQFYPLDQLLSFLLTYSSSHPFSDHSEAQIAFWMASVLVWRVQWKEAEFWLDIFEKRYPIENFWVESQQKTLRLIVNVFQGKQMKQIAALDQEDLSPLERNQSDLCLVAHCKILLGKKSEAQDLLNLVQYDELDLISAYFYLKTKLFLMNQDWSKFDQQRLDDYVSRQARSPLEKQLMDDLRLLSGFSNGKGSPSDLSLRTG